MSSVDSEIVALAEAIVHVERYLTGSTREMYSQLRGMVGGSNVAADSVISHARSHHRQVVEMECGHKRHYMVTSRQLTGQDETDWSRELVYAPSYYRAGVKVYCESCPGRPSKMCTGTTVDGFRIAWTVLTLRCGHKVTREHAAVHEPRDSGDLSYPCTLCGGWRRRVAQVQPFQLPAPETVA